MASFVVASSVAVASSAAVASFVAASWVARSHNLRIVVVVVVVAVAVGIRDSAAVDTRRCADCFVAGTRCFVVGILLAAGDCYAIADAFASFEYRVHPGRSCLLHSA